MAALLDVNALIALLDTDHIGHQAMASWFINHQRSGWATCPITENGFVRVLSQPAYASGQRTPPEAIAALNSLKRQFAKKYMFWPDDLSLCDESVIEAVFIAGTRQITDVYLLALAQKNSGTLVSFDRSLAWRVVKGASAGLVQHP